MPTPIRWRSSTCHSRHVISAVWQWSGGRNDRHDRNWFHDAARPARPLFRPWRSEHRCEHRSVVLPDRPVRRALGHRHRLAAQWNGRVRRSGQGDVRRLNRWAPFGHGASWGSGPDLVLVPGVDRRRAGRVGRSVHHARCIGSTRRTAGVSLLPTDRRHLCRPCDLACLPVFPVACPFTRSVGTNLCCGSCTDFSAEHSTHPM